MHPIIHCTLVRAEHVVQRGRRSGSPQLFTEAVISSSLVPRRSSCLQCPEHLMLTGYCTGRTPPRQITHQAQRFTPRLLLEYISSTSINIAQQGAKGNHSPLPSSIPLTAARSRAPTPIAFSLRDEGYADLRLGCPQMAPVAALAQTAKGPSDCCPRS